jgi:antitoxin component of RelBE/YafQ-DinJ toxin-antitoxin module
MRVTKTEVLQVRMTPILKERIEQRAKAMGLNTSDYVRSSLAANALETLAIGEKRNDDSDDEE